jgi:hypothetical protein
VGLAHRVCTEPQLSPVQSWEEICPFGQSRSAWAGADVSSAAAIPRIPTNQRTDTNERIAKCYGLTVNLWLLSASWCSPLTARRWCDRPQHYPRGHPLRPGRVLVGSIACSCGRHLTWCCECGAVTYGPALADGCSLLNGPARVRI